MEKRSFGRRDDLQGLRAVAVLLVVFWHAGIGALSGGYVGVDVFFVLSGFFITRLLLADADRNGRISLRDFYIRRAKRILPAAALTLLVTDLVAYGLLNVVRAREVVQDSLWAAAFSANVRFARQGTDYFDQWQLPSPIQHFWSLAVEEQYYLVWPAVMLLALLVALRRDKGLRPVLAVALAAILFLSLAWSVHTSTGEQTVAYFSPFTRAWEIALGALVAVGVRALADLGRFVRSAAALAGIAAIGVAATRFDATTAYPSWRALIPTAGAALVIVAGVGITAPASPVSRLLAVQPLRYVGDRSYSLYLWHWPVLILAAQYEGHALSTGQNLLLLLLAFAIACVTYSAFENPLRRRSWSPRAAVALAIAAIGGVVVVGGVLNAQIAGESRAYAAGFVTPPPYRVDVLPTLRRTVAQAQRRIDLHVLNPPVTRFMFEQYRLPSQCAAAPGRSRSRICRLGAPDGRRTLAVFGDSHAQMWLPALLDVAKRRRWAVVPFVKIGCAPLDWERGGGSPDCRRWFGWATAAARTVHPDVLLVTGLYSGGNIDIETESARGIERVAAAIYTAHAVVAILDAPVQQDDPADCLLRPGATGRTCSLTIGGDAAAANDAAASILKRGEGLRVIDPRPWFCFQSVCPMVVGKTIAYADRGHISTAYALQLARPFDRALTRVLRGANIGSSKTL